MSFDTFIERVLQHEGGYSDHSADPGGATRFGVTERVARKHGYTGDMREFPRSWAIRVYRADYWDAVRGDELPFVVAFQVADAAVNHGPATALKWLQQVVGVTADGKIGPITLAAVSCRAPLDVALRFNGVRLTFYTNLKTWPTFGKGWARRVADNLRHAAADA